MKVKVYYLSKWKDFVRKYGLNTINTLLVSNETDLKTVQFDQDYYLEMCENTIEKESFSEEDIFGILEDIFREFNSDNNPLVNHQEYIRNNDSHTSMSVGDLIKLDDRLYIVASMGFLEIKDPEIINRFT